MTKLEEYASYYITILNKHVTTSAGCLDITVQPFVTLRGDRQLFLGGSISICSDKNRVFKV